MNKLEKAADIVLKQYMNLKKKENILIVFDKNKRRLANIFLKSAKKITKNTFSIETPVAKINGKEPPKIIAEEMKKYAVVLLITTKSLSHTNARRKACKVGARIASMPGITEDIVKRTLTADYKKISKIGKRIAKKLIGKKFLRIQTKLGTDLIIPNRKVKHDNGLYHKKGSFGNLPAGEICFAPFENKTNGIFIVDKSMAGIGKLKSNIRFIVKDGYVTKIEGKDEAKKLSSLLKKFNNKKVYNIAELGIGTNYKAKITGIVLEDEKVLGTVHIALGDNTSYGGKIKAPMHLDGVISKPTIFADNKKIMENGTLLIGVTK